MSVTSASYNIHRLSLLWNISWEYYSIFHPTSRPRSCFSDSVFFLFLFFLSFFFLFFSTFCSLFTARLFSFLCTIMGKRKQLESNFLFLEVRWSNSWKQINGLLLGGLCTAKVSWLLWMNSGDNPQSFRAQSAVLLLTVKSRKIISFSKQSSVHQLPFFVLALKSFKREMHEMILRAAWLTLRVSQPLHNVTGNRTSNNLLGWCVNCVSFGFVRFGETAIKYTRWRIISDSFSAKTK